MGSEIVECYTKSVSNEDFIRAIKEHPTIWNRAHENYKDKVSRDAAWKEIVNTLLPDLDKSKHTQDSAVDEIKENWCKLRNSYTNAMKRRLKKRGIVVPWRLEKEMSFLKPFVEHRFMRTENLDATEETSPLSSPESYQETENQIFFETIPSRSSTPTSNTSYKRKNNPNDSYLEIMNTSQEKRSRNEDMDDLDMFFLSISKTVKKLPTLDRIRIKMDLLKAVSDAEIKQLESSVCIKEDLSVFIKKWNNLRDSYNKYRIRARLGKSTKPYIYATELKFLAEVFESRPERQKKDIKEEADENAADENNYENEDEDSMSEPPLPDGKNIYSVDLIRCIKKRPVIWNSTLEKYKEKFHRKKAWEEVYHEIIPGYADMDPYNRRMQGLMVTKKWYNIRDGYGKVFKKRLRNKRIRPYVHESEVNFLDAVIVNSTTAVNLDNDEQSDEEHNDEEQNYEEQNYEEQNDEETENFEENPIFLEVDTEITEPEASGSNFNPLSSENNHVDDTTMSVLMNIIEKSEDEDWAFFKSITPSVKSLSEDAKFEFRIEVMNLIKRLKKNDKSRKRMKVEMDYGDE